MSSLLKYAEEFWNRHDFSYEELKTLSERHPSVKVSLNIPVAWIIPIDELLCRFRYNQVIDEIGQEFGQLIVRFKNRPEDQEKLSKYKDVVEEYEKRIREIDRDIAKEHGLEI